MCVDISSIIISLLLTCFLCTPGLNFGMRLLFSGGTGACGDWERARGELMRRMAAPEAAAPRGGVAGCGGGVPTSRRPTGMGL